MYLSQNFLYYGSSSQNRCKLTETFQSMAENDTADGFVTFSFLSSFNFF